MKFARSLLFRKATACCHDMNGEVIIDRAYAHTFHCCPAFNTVSFSALPPCLLVKNFSRELTSIIFIRSVSFIDRKCSLDSELSKFEGINVIGDIYMYILDFRAIHDRRKTDFPISAMCFISQVDPSY